MAFLLGLITGCLFGVFTTALCVAAGRADDAAERYGAEHDPEEASE